MSDQDQDQAAAPDRRNRGEDAGNAAVFGFRIRFHLEPTHRFRSAASELLLESSDVVLQAERGKTFENSSRFKIRGTGYLTIDEATAEGKRWFDALLRAGLLHGKGLDLGRFRLAGGLTHAGRESLSAAIKSPVRDDLHGLDVFDDEDGLRFMSVAVAASTESSLDPFVAKLREEYGKPVSQRVRLALELYGISRFANAPRVHFLTLITAVEVLADRQPLDERTRALVDRWLEELPADLPARDSLKGRLRELKQESIRLACRRLFEDRLPSARTHFDRLYSIRSSLVHDGQVPGTDFVAEAAGAETTVRRLLEAVLSASP